MKALYALCLSLAAFAFARPAQAELKYLSYEVQSGTVKELTAEEVEKLNVADKRWHETITSTAEDGTQTQTTEMLFVQDTDISMDYYIGVFEVTQAQANLLKLGNATGTYGYAYGVAYSNTGFPFATTPTLNNKPGLSFPTPDQWLAYASGTNRSLATSPRSVTNLRGGASLSTSASLTEWYNSTTKWQTGANAHGVIDIFGNAAEYVCDPETGDAAFYGWYTSGERKYSWESLNELTSPSETRLDAYDIDGAIPAIWGARLVYTTPAARTYTLTVTLDGVEVPNSKQEGLKEGDMVMVNPPEVAEWRRLSGCTIAPPQKNLQPPTGEALGRPYTFPMPATDLTFAYTSESYGTITVEGGTATVTHAGEPVAGTEVVAGDTVTLTAREPGAHERFTGWAVTEGEGEPTPIEPTTDDETQESAYTYTIPELQGGETFAFTAHFEIIPYATLTVKNGYAQVNGTTVTEVVNGDEVTLIHNALGAHQVFNGWVAPEGIAVENNRFTVSGLTGLGERLTFEAKIQTYPFVRVFGGKVSGTEGGHNDGEGYYYPGTTLNLTPSGLEGYTHIGWSANVNGTETTLQGNSYTLAADAYDVSIAITALYAAPTKPGEAEPGSGATIRLGYADTEGTKAYDLFGSEVAADVKLDDGYGNVYAFPGYTPAGAIATFDLTDNTISYGEPAADAGEQPSLVGYEGTYAEFWREYMAWWQKAYGTESTSYSNAALTLRRVTRATDDPYDDFYLGVYETSIANVAYLQKLCVPNEKERLTFLDGRTGDAKPYCFTKDFLGIEMTERDALIMRYPVPKVLSMIGEAFEVTVAAPNKSDLVAVAGTPPADNPGAGQGANKDTKIVKGMVVCSTNNTVTTVYGMDPDPYGFYGIWGSQWEYVAEGVAVGGARDRGFGACYVDNDEGFTIEWNRPYGITFDTTFRPKVAVEKPVTVTVQYRVGEATTEIGTVEVAPGHPLFADFEKATPVRAGYTFLRWELDGEALTANPTLAAGTTTATLTAVWEESSVFVEFEYVDCMGPSVGYPGQTICVYPPEGRQFVPNRVAIELSNREDVLERFDWPDYPDSGKDHLDFEDGSERFVLKTSFTVTEPVTITGKLVPIEEPEPEPEVKPGYRFRLR